MKKHFLLAHLLSLLMGGSIYVLFREDSLLMFHLFNFIDVFDLISDFRLTSLKLSAYLPDWFLYSFPDGLWMFSYVCLLLFIWNKISKHNFIWFVSLPSLSVFSEIGQFFEIIPGTYDNTDLIFYILGGTIPVLITYKK